MSRSRLFMILGLILFLVGGAFLALGGEGVGAPVGTTVGLAGVGLLVWGWFTRSSGNDAPDG